MAAEHSTGEVERNVDVDVVVDVDVDVVVDVVVVVVVVVIDPESRAIAHRVAPA